MTNDPIVNEFRRYQNSTQENAQRMGVVFNSLWKQNESLKREIAKLERGSMTNEQLQELIDENERLREFGKLKDRAKLRVEVRERAYFAEVERLQKLVGAENQHIQGSRAELWDKMKRLQFEHEKAVRELQQEVVNLRLLIDEKPLHLVPEVPQFAVGDRVRGLGVGSGVMRTGAIQRFGVDPINNRSIAVISKDNGATINIWRDTLEHA